MSRVNDDGYDSSDDGEPPNRSEENEKAEAQMSDDERKRFHIFRFNCKFPPKQVREIMRRAAPGYQVQDNCGLVGSWAAQLFCGELVETARKLSGNNEPLTPDLIFMAFNELDSHDKLPGKIPGVKRSEFV